MRDRKSTRVHTLIDTHVHTLLHTTLNASHSETNGPGKGGGRGGWILKGRGIRSCWRNRVCISQLEKMQLRPFLRGMLLVNRHNTNTTNRQKSEFLWTREVLNARPLSSFRSRMTEKNGNIKIKMEIEANRTIYRFSEWNSYSLECFVSHRNEREIDLLLSYFSVKYKVNKRNEKRKVDDCNDNKNEIVNCNNMTCILVTFSIILVRSCPPTSRKIRIL